MLDNRYTRTARTIAAKLETENKTIVDVSTPVSDSLIFHTMMYLNHYFGRYSIMYLNDGTAIIRKQG